MKLLLIWLLGVPMLVGTMVLARAALAPAQPVQRADATAVVEACLRHAEYHLVPVAIAQQRHARACNALAIQ